MTLAPVDISDAQPQVKGVSPGHSGVSGFSVTLMSLSVGSLPFTTRTGIDYAVFLPTIVFAVSTMRSTVNPSSVNSLAAGADAPKRSIPSTTPSSPAQ